MGLRISKNDPAGRRKVNGLAGWLLSRFNGQPMPKKRLALLERITLGPRQGVALIEVDGRNVLIATGPDGSPAFYPLEDRTRIPVRRRIS